MSQPVVDDIFTIQITSFELRQNDDRMLADLVRSRVDRSKLRSPPLEKVMPGQREMLL